MVEAGKYIPFHEFHFMKIPVITACLISILHCLLNASSLIAQQSPAITPRIRPAYAVRLGGVFSMGLSKGSTPFEESANLAAKVSDENRVWIGENCDLTAFDYVSLPPRFYAPIVRDHPLFTPMIRVSATKMFENNKHSESVGGWKDELLKAALKPNSKIILPIDNQAHWMDCSSKEWASHWREQAYLEMRETAAQGVVATDLPVNPKFPLWTSRNDTFPIRLQSASDFLQRVHAPVDYFLNVEATGFNTLAGHTTLPPAYSTGLSELSGRLWDELAPHIDGALVSGWVYPLGAAKPTIEKFWEIELEAADRYARQDKVFIAQAAYHNDTELEYVVASYLLVAHRQGRFVLQPMPVFPGRRLDAGLSLQVLQKELIDKSRYFNVKLGYSDQERHLISAEGGMVWRRAYDRGIVYVNSSDSITVRILMGGAMQRIDGSRVKLVQLKPHTGCILLYSTRKI